MLDAEHVFDNSAFRKRRYLYKSSNKLNSLTLQRKTAAMQ